MTTRRVALCAVLPVLATATLGACSDAPADPPVPARQVDVDLPPGVTLTSPGATLGRGDTGTTVLDLGNGARSAVTVTVRDVREGDLDDFRFFTLDESAKGATPFYVDATVRNEGPAGLGGSSVPIYLHSDADVLHPPTELVGDFEPCPLSTLPAQFLAGASAQLCFVYLVPKGQEPESVDVVPSDEKGTLRWGVEELEEDDPDAS